MSTLHSYLPGMTEHTEPLDQQIIGELKAIGDREFLTDLFESYIADAQVRLSEIEAGYEEGSASRVGNAAHTLKGASGNLGAKRVAELAEKLQHHGRKGELAGMEQWIEQLRLAQENAEVALRQELEAL